MRRVAEREAAIEDHARDHRGGAAALRRFAAGEPGARVDDGPSAVLVGTPVERVGGLFSACVARAGADPAEVMRRAGERAQESGRDQTV